MNAIVVRNVAEDRFEGIGRAHEGRGREIDAAAQGKASYVARQGGDVHRQYRLAERLGARVEQEGKALVDEELRKIQLFQEGAQEGSGVLDYQETRRGARGQVALEQIPCAEAEGDDEASGGLRELEPLRLALGIDEGMQGRFPLPSAHHGDGSSAPRDPDREGGIGYRIEQPVAEALVRARERQQVAAEDEIAHEANLLSSAERKLSQRSARSRADIRGSPPERMARLAAA